MIKFIASKAVAAQFVADILTDSELNLQSIMITRLEKSEDFCVYIATGTSSVDTVKKWVRNYYETLTITYQDNTPGG